MVKKKIDWPWVNTNYHQNWVGEHPNKDYYIHFWDVHQGYRVLTHTHVILMVEFDRIFNSAQDLLLHGGR